MHLTDHFRKLGAYNKWANARIYAAALALEDAHYRRDVGAFFKSLHGTLNHLLLTDRIWLKRLTGEGDHPARLDAIIHEDRRLLTRDRMIEDDRIIHYIGSLDQMSIQDVQNYTNSTGKLFTQTRSEILSHVFNHQTHHRGQAHTVLSILSNEAPSLDLMLMQRGVLAPDLSQLL